MAFVRIYVLTSFLKNEPLSRVKLDWGLNVNLILIQKKCSTAQRFIRKEVTSYKIHTLPNRLKPDLKSCFLKKSTSHDFNKRTLTTTHHQQDHRIYLTFATLHHCHHRVTKIPF